MAVFVLAVGLSACAPMVSELKAGRNPHVEKLHERLSRSIHDNGFSHGIRSMVGGGESEIDTIFVAIPLDSLKRRFITLHHMLLNVAMLCARPEFSNVTIQIELNTSDEEDLEYMRGIVAPVLVDARNVTLVPQRENSNDLVITLSTQPIKRPLRAPPAASSAQ
jgi:hypothetical protein